MSRIHEILWAINRAATDKSPKHQPINMKLKKVLKKFLVPLQSCLLRADGLAIIWNTAVCICKVSKCHRIIINIHREPIINRILAPTKVNGCIKYEQNLLHAVGCKAVTRAGPKHQSVYSSNFKVRQNPRNEHRDPIISRVHAPTGRIKRTESAK